MNFAELSNEMPELAQKIESEVLKAEADLGPGTGPEKKKAALKAVLTPVETQKDLSIIGDLIEVLISGDEETQKATLSQAMLVLYDLFTFIIGRPPGPLDLLIKTILPTLPNIIDEVADRLFGKGAAADATV